MTNLRVLGSKKIMYKQERFYDVPTDDPPPRNRRIYAMAKAPFGFIWQFLAWASKPWLKALPFAMAAAFVLAFLSRGPAQTLKSVAVDALTVGVVWTAVLGAVFALFMMIAAARR
jgi:hypothetical protein